MRDFVDDSDFDFVSNLFCLALFFDGLLKLLHHIFTTNIGSDSFLRNTLAPSGSIYPSLSECVAGHD
jgi:hypothetical protein